MRRRWGAGATREEWRPSARRRGTLRSALVAVGRSSSWWLIANHDSGWMEVLALSFAGGEEVVLPVFSFEQEAELFLRLGTTFARGGWQVRETGAGELASLLLGPLSGVERVALDPLPGRFAGMVIGLVSMDRATFIEQLLMGKGEAPVPRARRRRPSSRRRRDGKRA